MYDIVVEKTEEQEWAKGARWYEEQQSGLGERFISEVKNFLVTLETDPERFRLVSRHTRKAPILPWPYSAYFSVDTGRRRVTIVAIWHGRRNPATLRRRLARLET